MGGVGLEELTPELREWIYGPPSDEDDEPLSVGEQYRISEEEERFRWLPGYRECVERYLAELRRWHASWDRVGPYPEKPEELEALELRIAEQQRIRADPPAWHF